MLIALVASVPPTIAALAAWRGARRDPAGLAGISTKLDDLLQWQVDHEREHIRMSGNRRGRQA